jgi:PIN domain
VFLNVDPFATEQSEAAAQWRQARAQWRASIGEPADANERITRVQWCKLLDDPALPRGQIQPTESLRLVVPKLTLDELDGHTHAGNRRVSRSARAALAFLDPFVDTTIGGKAAQVSPDDPGFTLEVLHDAPGHQRQASNDAELLDRAEFFRQVSGPPNAPPVLVATGDRGMWVLGKTLKLANPAFPVLLVAMPEALRVPPSK